MKLQETWLNREQFIKDCKQAGACMREFAELISATTEQEWLNVICRNFWWCVERGILEEVLPDGLTCDVLDCYKCTSLVSLPKNLTCGVLSCFGCTSLVSLPESLTCEHLDCSGCTSLVSLPKNLTCKELCCDNCPLLEKEGE